MLADWSCFTSGAPRYELGTLLTWSLIGKLLWGEEILNQHVFVRYTFYVHCPGVEFWGPRGEKPAAVRLDFWSNLTWFLVQRDVIFGPNWRDFLVQPVVIFWSNLTWFLVQLDAIFCPTWRDFLLHKIVQFDVSVFTTRGRNSRVLIQTFYTKYHPN